MSGCVMELLFPAMLWKPELYTLVHWRGPDFNADSDRWLGPLGRPGQPFVSRRNSDGIYMRGSDWDCCCV
jgi:hypothetical protein